MHRNMTKGWITAGIIGATVGMYAASNMSSRGRRKMMKKGKKAFGFMKDLDMF
ncbi:hypothetical protein [Alkaliphilus oremlandii]|uniref:hypothetical protein n=1 Tax=Alkaliphilus oremlandii TaxID=461876 RepID=UPI0003157602|nr:hypothetical protein [Alkaliphilus oremlandii]